MKFTSEKCVLCTKSVYINEKLVINGNIFHKACFRCKDCNRIINGSNCAALNGVYYCKTHYNQMLKSSGSGYAPPGFSKGQVTSKQSTLMKSSSSNYGKEDSNSSFKSTASSSSPLSKLSTTTVSDQPLSKSTAKVEVVEQQTQDVTANDDVVIEQEVEAETGDAIDGDLSDEEGEVVEVAMVEVVHMYHGDDDDDDSDSDDSDTDSDDSDSDSEDDERKPPRDVSDSGLVPVMSGEQAERCVATASKKDIVQSPSLRLRVGFAETQGVRRSMEDRMTVLGRYMACDIADYFGLFDGHGGDETAHYVGEELQATIYKHIKKGVSAGSDDPKLNFALALEEPELVRQALTDAFHDLQTVLEAKEPPLQGGAVAAVALVLGDSLFVANCGDVRVIIVYADGSGMLLSSENFPLTVVVCVFSCCRRTIDIGSQTSLARRDGSRGERRRIRDNAHIACRRHYFTCMWRYCCIACIWRHWTTTISHCYTSCCACSQNIDSRWRRQTTGGVDSSM